MRAQITTLVGPIAWAVLVAVTLLAPGDMSPSDSAWARWLAAHGGDKVVHAALFLGQAFWLARLWPVEASALRAGGIAAALATLYGALLEAIQFVVPGRGFDPADLVANAVGAFLWPLGVALLRRR